MSICNIWVWMEYLCNIQKKYIHVKYITIAETIWQKTHKREKKNTIQRYKRSTYGRKSGMNNSATCGPFLMATSTANDKFKFRTNLHHGLQQVSHIRHQLMVWRQTVSYNNHLILHAILGNRQWLLETHQLLLQCFHRIWNKAHLLQQTEPLGTKFTQLHHAANILAKKRIF